MIGFALVFDGLLEPCTTLALWLGWTQHFLWDMNSGPDHSVIESKMRGGIAILDAVPNQQNTIAHQALEKFEVV